MYVCIYEITSGSSGRADKTWHVMFLQHPEIILSSPWRGSQVFSLLYPEKNYLLTTVFFFGIKHGGVAFTFASWAWATLGVSVILGSGTRSGTRSGTNQIIRVDIKRLCCTSPAHDCMVIPNPSVAIPHEEIQLWIAVWKYGTKKMPWMNI
jgi:hypothetical protein